MSERLVPVEYKCVIELDPIEERTAGGIIKPADRVERDQAAMTKATVLAIGPLAFVEAEPEDRVPAEGDRVLVNKYAGQFLNGPEDRIRVVNDKDILCIIEGVN